MIYINLSLMALQFNRENWHQNLMCAKSGFIIANSIDRFIGFIYYLLIVVSTAVTKKSKTEYE